MSKKNWRLNPSIFNSRWRALSLTTKSIKEIIKLYLSNGADFLLVDYGCGDMPYKPLFEPHINKYIGADLPFNQLAEIKFDPGGKIDLKNDYADVVLSTQVLEHVENPELYLNECFRILKNDGILILSTHGYWIYHPTPNDYWRWTSSGLKKILVKAGFEISGFRGIVSRPSMGIQLLQDSLIFKIPKFLIPFIAFPSQILMLICDKILSSQKSRDADSGIFMTVCKAKKAADVKL
jgi:SAM-dependent methyltransferase